MTAEIINLRRARKLKGRRAKMDDAQRNRAISGRPLHERRREAAIKDLAERRLDQQERNGSPEEE